MRETKVTDIQRPRCQKRRGSIVILAAAFMIAMLAVVAFAVDLGYLYIVRTEAQACADSAALASAWEIIGESRLQEDSATYETATRNRAIQFAGFNSVAAVSQNLDGNWNNDINGEIVIGRIEDPTNRTAPLVLDDPAGPNAVTVRVQRTADSNGAVALFFAQVLGITSAEITAEATATFRDDVNGFQVTETSGNSTLMPFVVHEDQWASLMAGSGDDNWSYNGESDVSSGSDGIREIRMFPESGGGNQAITPGNFGTVNINDANNSATTLRRIIRKGVSADDLSASDGRIQLDPNTGTLQLGGDPGVTASMQLALADVVGEPRTIMLYRDATGQGNNTVFTIVGFVGIRVVDYRLTGNDKHITVQPAYVVDPTATVGDGSNSSFIVQPAHLAR